MHGDKAVETAYQQVLEDTDEDITIKGQTGTYVGFNNRTIGGTVDVWDADVMRIDGRNSTVEGGVVLWRDTAEKLDLGNSQSEHVILRDSTVDAYQGARMETGYVHIKDARVGTLTLTDAVLDALLLDGAEVGTVDLSGAVLGGIDAGEDAVYEAVMDDDTYIHEVPEEFVEDLGYRQVTEQERNVLYAVDRLGYRSADPVAAETVAWYVQDVMGAADSPQEVHGTASSLTRKRMLETEAGQYAFTPRGMHAHAYTTG